MNWLDALATRLGNKPARKMARKPRRRFQPSLESLDRRDVPSAVAPTSSICGYVYCDTDCDGVKDAGEAGIGGVTINLTGTDAWGQPVSLSTTTGADGAYCFTQDTYGAAILPGTYTVTEVQPAGYADGKDTQGTPASGTVGNDTFVNVSLGDQTTGVNAVNYNFGEVCPTPPPPKSSLCGFVYVDCDNDGVKDAGEAGIGGVKVTLTGTDATGAVTRTAYTDATGAYCFTDLLAGTYKLTETQPAGYADGKDTQGTPGTGTVSNDMFSNIVLAAGVNGKNNNFGEVCPPPPPKGSICGTVYVDCNKNGTQDAGEPGIGGVCVTLTGPGGTRTATTDCNGDYCFTDLVAGSYKLTESQPNGYLQGTTKAGNLGGAVSGDMISGIPVNGTKGTEYNFGEQKKGSICGKVGYDRDCDGWFGHGDGSLCGVKVTLKDKFGNCKTTYTDKDGCYSFCDLDDGCYTLSQSCPSGFRTGSLNCGSLGGYASGGSICNVAVKGDCGTGYDFCNKLAFGCWAPPTNSIGCWW